MSYFDTTKPGSIDWRFSPWAIPVLAYIAAVFVAYPFWRVYTMLQKLFRTERGGAIIMLVGFTPILALAWYFRFSIGQ